MSAPADNLATVIAAGRQSRTALAAELAAAFRRNPAQFDPQSLERLGAVGLRQFLGEVGANGGLVASAHGFRGAPKAAGLRAAAPASGWRYFRRAEWPVWIAGVGAGVRAGGFVIGAGLLMLFATERIAPLVREFLR